MESLIRTLRSIYRLVVPDRVRSAEWVSRVKARMPLHNVVYDAEYFATHVDGPAVESAPVIVDSVTSALRPTRVVDVGCGTGALLAEFQKRGCQVLGLEYADAAIELCRARQVPVNKLDLERDTFAPSSRFDLAISMEVAEHLPPAVADRYVDLLTVLAPFVLFTAAAPGQGGTDHVNEQPASYWIAKFAERGLEFDRSLTDDWRRAWERSGRVSQHYYRNLMIFRGPSESAA